MLTELRILTVDTLRLCWRLLPQLLAIYLAGWLGSQLALKIAVIVGDVSAWFALAIFATSFLFTLVAIVLILRTCGRELGISSLIPSEESIDDGRDSSVATLLGVTLLPFLGLYAAFGQVQDRATRLATEQIFRNSFLSETSVLRVVADLARNHVWYLLLIFVGLYLLRRLLDWIHEKSGLALVGLLVAFVEANFILLAIFGGFGVANRLTRWIRGRAVIGWWDQTKDAVLSALSVIHEALPELVLRVFGFFAEQVWPALWTTVSQPVIWLAVAALIYGSNVLSLAELMRRGRPLASRIPGASHFATYREKVAFRRVGPPPVGVRRVGSVVRDAFLGDIDDKYLPTLHSLRLVLRGGVTFVGAFIFCYTVVEIVRNLFDRIIDLVIGGRDVSFWFMAGPVLDVVREAPVESLRLCLLAVAFRRCLELLALRGRQAQPVMMIPSAEQTAR